jgi:hypothetical protein
MDDLMAARLYSGPGVLQIGEQLRLAIQLVDSPLRVPESEQEFAAACSFPEELRQDHREWAAAYWLFVSWVCTYHIMHGVLSPADRPRPVLFSRSF